jgi:hypothetical protein
MNNRTSATISTRASNAMAVHRQSKENVMDQELA